MSDTFKNPILPGFYPDPSICRVGEDYYLVTSTFAYFPGVPIFHSKDLVNWEQIGNILDRKEQLKLENAKVSAGIFAPTIRYHNGIFYMITTNVSNRGNFIVKAERPEGPWSEPYFIKGAPGIDPSLFFDDDGKTYCMGVCERREGGKYYGDNEVWVCEIDLNEMKLIGESFPIWHGAMKNVVWPEAPHLYKKDGFYYLVIAEGGTGEHHAVTVARSKILKTEFEGNRANPILTHRHLGRNYPIVNVGHGDLTDTQNGEWWMVLLASRPYGGYYRNLGRETFLVPVVWENGWPVVNYGVGLVEETMKRPNLPKFKTENKTMDDFDGEALSHEWMFLRNPNEDDYSLTEKKGFLRIKLSPNTLSEMLSPSYVCVRQKNISFTAETVMEFKPESEKECAGLCIFQNDKYYYRMVLTMANGENVISLIKCENGNETEIACQKAGSGKIYLRISEALQDLSFYFSFNGTDYTTLFEKADARILSTDVAGGFVGNTIGLYCSGNGSESSNCAYFDWFKYKGEN